MRLFAVILSGLCGCSFSGGAALDPGDDGAVGDDAGADGPTADLARRRVVSVGAVPAGAGVTDMPVPVRLSGDADLMANASADGTDLLFQLADGTRLPHDIERLDVGAGDLIAWVVLPDLGPAGASFELYYGDGNAAPAAPNPWDGVADLVFHFESATGVVPDHSPSGADGNFEGDGTYELASGQIGDAVDATNSGIFLTNGEVVDRDAGSFSLGFWFSQDNALDNADLGWFKGGFSSPGYQVTMGTGAWRVNVEDVDGDLVQAAFGDETELGAAGFVHLVLVVDRSGGQLRAYTDGALADNTGLPGGFGSTADSTTVARVGALGDGAADADYDELRAYPGELTDDWIATDHALGSMPDLVTVGAAEAAPYP